MAMSVKRSLSKNLTGMKFMQKGTQGSVGGGESVDGGSSGGELIEKWIASNVSTVTSVSHKIAHTDSFVECEDLNKLGRFSYKKFNKEVERLSERYARQGGVLELESGEEEDDEDVDVSVLEMVRRYEDIKSKRLLGKRGRMNDDDFDSSPGYGETPGRHKLLENRVSKMDRDGFLRPS